MFSIDSTGPARPHHPHHMNPIDRTGLHPTWDHYITPPPMLGFPLLSCNQFCHPSRRHLRLGPCSDPTAVDGRQNESHRHRSPLSDHQDDRPTSDLAPTMVVEVPTSSAIWSRRSEDINFDRLHKALTMVSLAVVASSSSFSDSNPIRPAPTTWIHARVHHRRGALPPPRRPPLCPLCRQVSALPS
jgi:hypothetical protein